VEPERLALKSAREKYYEDRDVGSTFDNDDMAYQVSQIVEDTMVNWATSRSSIDYASLTVNPQEAAKRHYNLSTAKEPTIGRQDITSVMTSTDDQITQGIVGSIDESLPYRITSEEYSDENVGYDKLSLFYYNEDDVVIDEEEIIQTDIDYTIGWDALKSLDSQSVVWVRNDSISTDYEIVLVEGSYEEIVMGLTNELTPSERRGSGV